MTWAKVDDGLHLHAKIRRAGPAAMGLWVVALSFCGDQLTDGVVEREDAEGLAQRLGVPLREIEAWVTEHAAKLVTAELWEATATGWTFHDWFDLQPSRTEVLAKREQGASAAHARWSGRRNAVGDAGGSAVRNPVPSTRPVPSRPDPISPEPSAPTDRSDAGDGAPASPASDVDPWGLGLGGDPDEDPPTRSEPPAVRGGKKADLDPATLSGWERRIAETIRGDASLAPICPRPNALARDLALAAPAVDIVREVRGLGAWMRQNPAKGRKKNGGAFLLRNLSRKQEAGGTRGFDPPREQEVAERERAAPATPPPRPEIANGEPDPQANIDAIISGIGRKKTGSGA